MFSILQQNLWSMESSWPFVGLPKLRGCDTANPGKEGEALQAGEGKSKFELRNDLPA